MATLRSDKRAASAPLSYILNLGILVVVLASVTVLASGYFQGQTEIAQTNQLEETGQSLSRDIQSVDRLVRASSSSGEIGRTVSTPRKIGSKHYTIQVINEADANDPATPCSRQCIILRTNDGTIQTRVYFTTETPVESTSFSGGSIRIVRPDGGSTIEFQSP